MTQQCVLCQNPDSQGTYNADPVAEGLCCADCNWNHVVPARWRQIRRISKLTENLRTQWENSKV